MDMFLAHLDFWHWLILGALLLIFEIMFPGAFFLWMSIAAVIVGTLLLPFPKFPWEYQIILFALLSIVSAVTWRWYTKKRPAPTDQPRLNRRGEQYIGRVITLQEAIVNGQGKIKVDDSTWRIEGEDCPPGTRVHIVGARGTILQVKRSDEGA